MIIYRTLVAALVLLGAGLPANATTMITEVETGVISGTNTTDTLGLFGPAGANLAGQTISIHMQYVPGYFSAPTVCRNNSCTDAVSQNNPNTPGAVLISITVNGKQVTYASTHYGEVTFSKNAPDNFFIYADTSSFGDGYNGVWVRTLFNAPVTFGSTLSPQNQPVFGTNVDEVAFFTPQNQLPSESLTFAVSSATQ